MRSLAIGLAVVGATGAAVAAARQVGRPPVVSVWYRGTPEGVPRLDDLAALRAAGFTGVTWPPDEPAAVAELTRLARTVDLAVVTRPDLTVRVTPGAPRFAAAVWRALARGSRAIAFDPGQRAGPGLTDPRGERLAWVRPATEFAGQVSANPRLLGSLGPGPKVVLEAPAPRDLEVTLLDGGRAWVLVATNTAPVEVRAVARLPPGVPYALWVSLLDGGTMSMLREAGGARWTLTIGAGDARVYVIDKTLK